MLQENKYLTPIRKLKHSIEYTKVREKGFDLDDELKNLDPRNYQFKEHFETDVFGAVLPDKFLWNLEELPILPFQNSILSCVSCTCSFINSFNSKRVGNDAFLSWRFPYSLVPHYNGGTSVRDNLNVLRKKGQCEDNLLPQRNYYFGEKAMQNRNYISEAAYINAENYRIRAFYFMAAWNELELKTAIMKSPIGVGLYIGRNWYASKINHPGKPIKFDGSKQYGHLIAFVGWNTLGWIFADWDNKGLFILDYSYPLSLSFLIYDLSDRLKSMLMKSYKLEGTNRLLIVLPNGKYQYVDSLTQWQALHEKKMILGETQIIKQAELNKLTKDENPLVIVK